MTDKAVLARLIPDPHGRKGVYLDPKTDTPYNMGLAFELPTSAEPKSAKTEDLTHTKVQLKDGPRGIVTEMGDPEEDEAYFCRVQTEEGVEVEVATKADMKPLTKAQIAAWDKEIEDKKG